MLFSQNRKLRWRLIVAAMLAVIAVAIIISHTDPAHPRGGARYTGTLTRRNRSEASAGQLPIAFAVSASGDRVENFRFAGGLPRSCGPNPAAAAGPASATVLPRTDTFLARVPILHGGTRVGTVLVQGAFETLGRVSGGVQTTFSTAALRRCGAHGSYTART